MTPYTDRRRSGHYDARPAEADVDATGKAAEKAAELGVDITTVAGTGKEGRVTVTDVESAAATADSQE